MPIYSLTICAACSRLKRKDPNPKTGVVADAAPLSCTAYPIAIPPSIKNGWEDHRSPRGDEADGLIFELQDGPYPALILETWDKKAPKNAEEEEKDGM